MAEQKGVMLQPSGTGPVVGIDLGTTYSVVAMHRRGKVEIFSNDNGSRTTPSIVGFLEGEAYIGDAAKDLPASRQVYDAKRMLGRPWKDEKLQSDRQAWPFDVVEDNGAPRIKVDVDDGRTEMFAPEQISAMVLQNLKETAESALGEPVSRAVITVPAYFDERQRQATRDAGRIAGLEVVAMINEPTAGAIAYGLDKKSANKKTVFIYDLGGGTFDVSVMTIEGNDFKVLASDGDTHLGGQDFDRRLLTHCIADIRKQHGVDLMAQKEDMQTLQDLRKACELAKRKLSNLPEASLSTFLTRQQIGYSTKISRARFEELCADLFKKTVEISNRVLADAKVSRSAIDEVVLVGGSTRIPKVCALLTELFGKEPRKSINPDEAVAYGAAVHAAVLSGDKFLDNLVKLKDVTPLSLGIMILGDRFSAVIEKNSPIPCKNTKKYYTVYDNQSRITTNVYQGERPMVKDNHCLNKEFSVDVPLKPAGQATVDVTFEIDTDGLLTVTAVEPTRHNQVQVRVTQREAHLSDKDIQDMMEKAKRFQRQDAEELRRVEEALRLQRLF